MAYVTQAQLEDRFGAGSLKDWTDDAAAGAIDTDVVASVIAETDGLINEAASQHYTTPLTLGNTGVAAAVRLHAGSIAGYLLASRRPDDVPENLRTMYEDARRWLDLLRAGQVYLAGEVAVSADKPAGGIVVRGGTRIVSRDSMDGL